MSNHLHLHLGAHKTASTHFQHMLEIVNSRNLSGVLIPAQATIRNNITHGNRFLATDHKDEVRVLLNSFLSDESQRVIVSEENLIGEAKDFYDTDVLYSKSRARLTAFADLLPNFQNITIWFFIRSLDSFLPSIYCEYLRHWRYRKFGSILNGHYKQSWVPVVNTIQSIFPGARLNVIDYHQYKDVLPRVLASMTGTSSVELPHQLKVIRPRLSDFAVRTASLLPDQMRAHRRQGAVDTASRLSRLSSKTKPFSPFNQFMTEQLQIAYNKDLDSLRDNSTISLME